MDVRAVRDDRQLYVRNTIRELMVYAMFVLLLCISEYIN